MNKQVYIIRGVSGSGKSTLALKLAELHSLEGKVALIFETDNYFVDENNEYKFDASKLKENHAKCFNDFLDALNDRNVDVVIVANTFTRKWEYVNYADAAKDSGYEVTTLIANGNYKNVHNVPDDVVQKMKNRFEY